MTQSTPRVLLSVSDASPGNQRQADALCEALAERLHLAWSHYTLQPQPPWRWTAPRRLWGSASGFDPGLAERLDALRPQLVVGCGRQAALATRIAKRRVKSLTVQILDPRIASSDWDLIVQPNHDPSRTSRTLITRGSLHPVNPVWLAAQRESMPELGAQPAPRQLVLLGGPTKHCRFGIDTARAWCEQIAQHSVGCRWVIGSRRSPDWLRAVFRTLPADRQWWNEQDGPNPYAAALAWADQILLTADSVNMLSEAAATSASLKVLPADSIRGRLAEFHQLLYASGRLVVDWQNAQVESVVEPWRDLDETVAQVIARLFSDAQAIGPRS